MNIKRDTLKFLIKEIAKQFLKETPYTVGLKYWWMDPHYEFHEVPYEQHRYWATDYLKKRGYVVDDKTDVYKLMHQLGFVRVVKMNYKGEIVLSYSYSKERPLTSKQLQKLRDKAIEERCGWITDDNTGREKPLELTEEIKNEKQKQQIIKNLIPRLKDDNVIVTVNSFPEMPAANYVQVDFVIKGKNILSTNPENLIALGFKMPNTKQLINLPSGKYKISDLKGKLTENMTYDELLRLTADTPRSPDDGTNRIERSKNVRVRSIPVSVEEGLEQWNFRYRSAPGTGNPGKPLEGHITFVKGEVGRNDSAEDLDVKVDCSCRDYKYKFAHNNFKQGAGDIGPDSLNQAINRPPKPAYDIGEGLCKHLTALSKYLQTQIKTTQRSNLFEALRDVARRGPFNITYYD
jgi:hypothetical protein